MRLFERLPAANALRSEFRFDLKRLKASCKYNVEQRASVIYSDQPIARRDRQAFIDKWQGPVLLRIEFVAPYPVRRASRSNIRARVLAGVG
jgi:hypothetical protein